MTVEHKGHPSAQPGRAVRAWRVARWVILGLAVILLAARLALPGFIEKHVNQDLGRVKGYSGKIGRVTVHLWRGAYRIHDINIAKSGGKVPVPLFKTPDMDLSLQWKELFHGALVGSITLDHPVLNFVSGPSAEESQSGEESDWKKTIENLFPLRINEFRIEDGEIRFRDFYKKVPVNLYLTNLFCVATNLSNSRELTQKLPAGVTATARTLGGGDVRVAMNLDPLAEQPTFELRAFVTNVDLTALNDFLRAYGKLDVESGKLDLITTTASLDGRYDGTLKVLFDHLKVWSWEKERKKNILRMFWEGIAGVLSSGFKNHPHDRLAAEIPISGSFTNLHMGAWSAAGSVLHNAFIRVLLPKIEKPKTLEDVERKEEKGRPAPEASPTGSSGSAPRAPLE